jgi:DNA-binding IclR family transcriptional regulator
MSDTAETVGAGARTIRLLRAIAEKGSQFSLSDLAADLELPPSTVHRLLQTMIDAALIERADGRAYRIGPELFRIATLIADKFDLAATIHPFLEALWKDWQETCTFSVYRPDAHKGMILDLIRSPHPLRFAWERFDIFDLCWGPHSHAILAFLPLPEIEIILERSPAGPYSGKPLPPRDVMLHYLSDVRARGYAVLTDSETLDLAGVGAPVFNAAGGVLGCVGVVMPATRFNKGRENELIDSVVQTAHGMMRALGAAAG